MTALAAEFGGTPATPELDAIAVPTLLEMARDNATQGCVGETWAALLARHQADTAELPQIRDLMTEIAADETEHAELAWAIDAWLHTKLSPAEQTEVLATRTAACDSLHHSLAAAIDHPAQQAAGLPRRATALALHEGLRRALWTLPA
jgi:Mn-containing catalase